MCGIIGYIGQQEAQDILVAGLRQLEYRGYDSAGIAVFDGQQINISKHAGKVEGLAKAVAKQSLKGSLGMGHTRWATHGAPNQVNAHPHQAGHITIIHNGIIENYAELKSRLPKGTKYVSETDTEVLAHLINHERGKEDELLKAVTNALRQVEGTFGLVVMSDLDPDRLIAARRGSPLLIGIGDGETYLASDATAVIAHTNKVVYLNDDEVAVVKANSTKTFDLENQRRYYQTHQIEMELSAIEKGGYDHFLLKEIMEQPKAVTDILRGRLDAAGGNAHLGGLNLEPSFFRAQQRFLTIGCGTAYYAGLLGKYLLERMTGLPVDVEVGSEFRYRDPALTPGTLALIISQSGETADTLASLQEIKQRGVHALGLVNVVGSSIAREVDGGVYLHAGPEISVASTKAFTNQVIGQLMLGLQVARYRDMSPQEGREIVKALEALPQQIEEVLKQAPQIQKLAKKFAKYDNAMYLGRDALFPVALEASHKIKEISYIHAEAYPAGEMKHGANALIDENLLVVFLAPQNDLYAKAKSNLEEVRARKGTLLVLASEGDKEVTKFTDAIIRIPANVSPWTQALVANVPLQLFAYYVAVERGTDVDQPRNLAKSVTVE